MQKTTTRRKKNNAISLLDANSVIDPILEEPTKRELIINLKTANQIGLTIPPNVLAPGTGFFGKA